MRLCRDGRAMRRISAVHVANCARKTSSVMVTRQLAPLHGFGTFIGGFELRIHPLVAEEAGAIFGDAVAAHQADGFAHHVGAMTGVPELEAGHSTLATASSRAYCTSDRLEFRRGSGRRL